MPPKFFPKTNSGVSYSKALKLLNCIGHFEYEAPYLSVACREPRRVLENFWSVLFFYLIYAFFFFTRVNFLFFSISLLFLISSSLIYYDLIILLNFLVLLLIIIIFFKEFQSYFFILFFVFQQVFGRLYDVYPLI